MTLNPGQLNTPINASLQNANTIVAGRSGYCIVVFAYFALSSAASQVCTWESSGGNILGGPFSPAQSGGAVCQFDPTGWFCTLPGEGLVLYNSIAQQVGGHLKYAFVPAGAIGSGSYVSYSASL